MLFRSVDFPNQYFDDTEDVKNIDFSVDRVGDDKRGLRHISSPP